MRGPQDEKAIMPTTKPLSRRELLQWGGLSLAGITLHGRAEAQTSLPPPRFLLEWGRKGKAEGEFDAPIGMAINRADEIFVTEFRNNRVQKFTREGKFVAAFPVAEMPGGIAVD